MGILIRSSSSALNILVFLLFQRCTLQGLFPVQALTDFCKEPLGLESGIIKDPQITADSHYDNNNGNIRLPKEARLNNANSWCSDESQTSLSSTYLQIDLGQVFGITKIATQGDPTWSPNYVLKYRLEYSFNGNEFYKVINPNNGDSKIIDGNTDNINIVVRDFYTILFTGRYVRFYAEQIPVKCNSVCLRVELYGCRYVCPNGLGIENNGKVPIGLQMSSSSFMRGKEADKARLDSVSEWCAANQDTNQYLDISLGKLMTITGIATQGSSSSSKWVESFTLEHGDSVNVLTQVWRNGKDMTFKGNKDSTSILTNWFQVSMETKYLRIRPKMWHSGICMRIEIMGCSYDCLQPLGLESTSIPDSRLSQSNIYKERDKTRLNDGKTWCSNKNPGEQQWASVDLGSVMQVRGIATQGDVVWGANYWMTYRVEYSFDNINWQFVKKSNDVDLFKTFTGNKNNLGVKMEVFPAQGFAARYVRLRRLTVNGGHECLRFELYGCTQHCKSSLGVRMGSANVSPSVKLSAKNLGVVALPKGRLFGKEAWCPGDQVVNPFLEVDLGATFFVNGVVIQGDPLNDNWVQKLKVQYKDASGQFSFLKTGSTEVEFELIGGRDVVTNLWFSSPVATKTIRLLPTKKKGKACLRIDLLGCRKGCFEKIGIESKLVNDNGFTASSIKDSNSVPKNSRLNDVSRAWISCSSSTNCFQSGPGNAKEWIEVCLDKMTVINGLILQGGGDQSISYVKQFSLYYKYSKSGNIHPYKQGSNMQMFNVQIGRYSSEEVTLPMPVYCRCIRLQVESSSGNEASLRWELLGCNKAVNPDIVHSIPGRAVRNREGTLECHARGQPEILFQWTRNKLPITSGGIYTIPSTQRTDNFLQGTSKSILKIKASPKDLKISDSSCSQTDGNLNLFKCSITFKCAAYYHDHSKSTAKDISLEVTSIQGKASAPKTLKLTSVTNTSATLHWFPPDDPSDFSFKYYEVKIDNVKLTSNTRKLTRDNLKPYKLYHVTITLVNSVNVISMPLTGQFRTDEGQSTEPHTISGLSPSSDIITAKWQQPITPNGIITKYRIKYQIHGSSRMYYLEVMGNNTFSKDLTALKPYTEYDILIQAYTKRGTIEGKWSKVIRIRTAEGKPSAPRGVTLKAKGTTELEINWNEPQYMNGLLKHYKITAFGRKDYNSSFMDKKEKVTNERKGIILTYGGTKYTVYIVAVTGGGEGENETQVFSTPIRAPEKPRSKINKVASGLQIDLFAASNINGPISHYELIVLDKKTHANCHALYNKPRPLVNSAVINVASTKPYTVQILLGEKTLKGANITLPIVGNFSFCYRAVAGNKAPLTPGPASSFIVERKSLPKSEKVSDSGISATSFKIQIIKGPGNLIKYYHVCVVELQQNDDNPSNPSNFPPSVLKPYNTSGQPTGVPYIAAEFSADNYDQLKNFVVGDAKEYSLSKQRRRRDSDSDQTYINVALNPGSKYSLFQRALESSVSYYTSAWIEPVTMKQANKGERKVPPVNKTIPIVVSVLTVLVAVSVSVIAGVVILRNRRKKDKDCSRPCGLANLEGVTPEKSLGIVNHISALEGEEEYDGSSAEEGLQKREPPSNVMRDSRFTPVARKDFAHCFKQKKRDSSYQLSQEYKNLLQGQQFDWDVAVSVKNKPKNRFANISAYNHSRVKLTVTEDNDIHSDYINASFIENYEGQPCYIACQGPLAATVDDFWRMIWEQDVLAIVMLTNLVERGKQKCALYWPEKGSVTHGNISIKLVSKELYADYSIKLLTMTKRGEKRSKNVHHYHYLSWPDHGVPDNPAAVINLRRRLRTLYPCDITRNLIAVHCSAGVGRTGTFIVIDAMLELLRKRDQVDIFNYVNFLRSRRIFMVQNEDQYIFAYAAIAEYITCGVTEITSTNMQVEIKKLAVIKNGKSGLQSQFERLCQVSPEIYPAETEAGIKAGNVSKNRNNKILPRDAFRVVLQQSVYENDNMNYINATYVDGYKKKDAFIATQYPLSDTISDFWTMIYQTECKTIVILNREKEGNESYPVFWPQSNETVTCDSITVTLISEEKHNGDTTRILSLQRGTDILECEVIHTTSWPLRGCPKSATQFLDFVIRVEKSQQRSGNEYPVVVMCSDGAGRTGTFIAISMVLDRFKVEGLVDVFQTVKQIRYFRPQFVENAIQYQFCHDIILAYLDSFSAYGNFS